jgi:hypothetical protein
MIMKIWILKIKVTTGTLWQGRSALRTAHSASRFRKKEQILKQYNITAKTPTPDMIYVNSKVTNVYNDNYFHLHLYLHIRIYKSKIYQMTEGYKTCHNNIIIHTENIII